MTGNVGYICEPTAALFDREIATLLNVIRRLASEGRSIIYVTHRLSEVFEVADRVTVFRNGQSSPARKTADLNVSDIIRSMVGRDLGTLYPPVGAEQSGKVVLEANQLTCDSTLKPVDMVIRQGEIVGLTGQLGSGAAEFVQMLAGVRGATGGSALIGGAQLSLGNRSDGIRLGIAYCSADRKRDGLFLDLPIHQNLTAPWTRRVASRGWISSRRERTEAAHVAERFNIDSARLSAPVRALSGGNQQKVALGKWLGNEPQLLLVEEPTRGVDVGARADIYTRIRQLCSEGMAVVVASSDTSEILGLCDRIGAFYCGRMVEMRPRSEWTPELLVARTTHASAVV